MVDALSMLPTRCHGLFGTIGPVFLANCLIFGMRCNHGNQLAQPGRGFPCDIVDTGSPSMPRRIGPEYTISVRRRYTAILKTPRSNWHSAFPRLASAGPITRISFHSF